jgi:hypothetical protein
VIADTDKALVKITAVTSGIVFGGAAGFTRTRVVTFMVADKGPFSIAVQLVDYTPEKIWDAIGAEIATLRGIGAL